MKRTLRDFWASAAKDWDWALLLVPLIGLVAVWPLLTQSLPSTDDGALHLHRLIELDRCLQHGVLCLRWAPDFAYGYGYPGFNFYMNLPTLIAEAFHLGGLDFPQAFAAAMILAFFASGWGAYLLGRDLGGWKAGLVVATAYMYAPYQFFDSAYRGNLPELWALAFLPWLLWAGRRAVVRQRWLDIVPFAVVHAALAWSHNVFHALGLPVAAAYLLLLWWQRGRSWRQARRLGAMVGLGLALSAFFWLPAFFEQGWTRYSPGLFDYTAAFLSPKEMLAWPPQLDLDLLNPYPPRSQSWGMLILIACGLGIATWRAVAILGGGLLSRGKDPAGFRGLPWKGRGEGDNEATAVEWLFFFLVFVVASFMTLSASAFLWRTVTPLQVVQMPWRFLGIAALAGSICAGYAIASLPDRAAGRPPALLAAGGAIVLLVATSIPWTYAAPFPQPRNAGVADILRWELGTGLIGGTSAGEFLPIWASRLPAEPADPALLSGADPIATRLDEASLPEGAVLVSADYRLMRADLVIDSPQPFRARYKQFYFPGWQVKVDGQAVPLIATAPYGLLGFDVPAGEHHISVRPTTTPLRTAGTVVSILGVLVCIGTVVSRGAFPPTSRPAGRPPLGGEMGKDKSGLEGHSGLQETPLPLHRGRRGLGTPRQSEGFRQSPSPCVGGGAGTPRQSEGFRQSPSPCVGGGAETPRQRDDFRQSPSPCVGGGVGTPRQSEGFRQSPPPRARGGLRGGIVPLAALALLILIVKEGIIDRTDNLFRAHRFDGTRVPGVQTEAQINFGNVLVVHGYDLPKRPVASGQAVRVDLYLSARPPALGIGSVDGDYMAYARLVDEEGRLWSLRDNGTPQEFRPPPSTTIWPADAYGHWAYLAYSLPGTPPGEYWIEIGLFERGTWRGLNVLDAEGRIAGLSTRIGPVQIARPRMQPDADSLGIERRLDESVAQSLQCLGSTLSTHATRAGEHLDITLFWRATQRPAADYAVDLVLASDGEEVFLAGEQPLGRREHPPTAWDTGEIVRSLHRVRIPATTASGRYAVEARVLDKGGTPVAQAIRLGEIEVRPTDRSFAVPGGIQHRVDANLAGQTVLLGYDLGLDRARGGDSLAVTLYWQALREMDASYKVSVQLVGTGGVLAQVDAIPVAWTRPTTGWVAGEVLLDAYALSIPANAQPGTYQLIAGMYDERSLQRLAVLDASGAVASDHVPLHEVVIE